MVYRTEQQQVSGEGGRMSRKLKTQQKMISLIKKALSSQKAVEFQTAIVNAKSD